MRLPSMLATPTPELLASGDALFSYTETSPGSELYFMTSGAIDPNSSKGFELNVKSGGADVVRGTLELPNYQWQITYISDVLVSIKEDTKEDIKIYPNPTNGIVYVKGANIQGAKIYTLSGQVLNNYSLSANQVDVSQLSNGMYLLQLEDVDGQLYTQQFSVE